jgi:GAF domain-containing protein
MTNWFSQFLAQTPPQGRNAVRLALIFAVAASLAVLVFAFVAVQSGAWQAYAVTAGFVGFFLIEALVVKFARQDRVQFAGLLLIAGVCYIVLVMISLMEGIGLGLSIALAVVVVEIVFETLAGPLAKRAGIAGLAFACSVLLMDRFLPWYRPALPVVQYAIPMIAAGTVITIGFLMTERLVTWRDLGLARKLLISFGMLAFLALAVGVVANVGLNRVQGSYDEALAEGEAMELIALHMSNDSLTARRHEKDFLARWTDEGFDTAYENYIIPHQETVAEISEHIGELAAFTPIVERDLGDSYTEGQYVAEIALLHQSLVTYEQEFNKTVRLLEQKGFQDTGLEGEFRTAVHDIENRIYGRDGLEQLVITMLQIRRREKDYLLRGDQEYVDNVHQLVEQLKQQIASSEELDALEKTEMTTLADRYLVAFDTLVEKDVEIAAATEAFRTAAHTMEPLVEKFTATGAELSRLDVATAKTNSSQTLALSTVTLVLAVLLAVFLSVILSRQITRPVYSLTDAAQQLQAGNYDAQAEVTSSDEIGTLANAFNGMARQIQKALATVAQRAAELQTVAEVSASTSTVLETDKLLWNVSNLTKERFGLYHAHIYVMNAAGDTLVLAAGAGEAGRQMVAEGRSIPLDREQSLVARSAREHRAIIVNDVQSAPDFLPNPLLPETRSELAVPMLINNEVVGVFDIQSDQAGFFTQENADIQTTLAAQIAIALQNARSYASVQAQAEREALIASIGQKIQGTTTVEGALQVAIRELGRALAKDTRVVMSASENSLHTQPALEKEFPS